MKTSSPYIQRLSKSSLKIPLLILSLLALHSAPQMLASIVQGPKQSYLLLQTGLCWPSACAEVLLSCFDAQSTDLSTQLKSHHPEARFIVYSTPEPSLPPLNPKTLV